MGKKGSNPPPPLSREDRPAPPPNPPRPLGSVMMHEFGVELRSKDRRIAELEDSLVDVSRLRQEVDRMETFIERVQMVYCPNGNLSREIDEILNQVRAGRRHDKKSHNR